VNRGERRAFWHYRLRGYRIIGTNVRAGRNELDLIVRRGRDLTFVEVKQRRSSGFGGALGAVDAEKRRRVRRAAQVWLSRNPQPPYIRVGFEVIAITGGRLSRRPATMDAAAPY
jgi:putative endonuclease